MTNPDSIDTKTLDQLVAEVQGLRGGGDASAVRSVAAVIAKCSLLVAASLDEASVAITSWQQTSTLAARSTEALTQQLVHLNRGLTRATWVIAIGTVVVAGLAVYTELSKQPRVEQTQHYCSRYGREVSVPLPSRPDSLDVRFREWLRQKCIEEMTRGPV